MNDFNKIRNYNWHGKTILIVENNESCFFLLKELFNDTNAKIIHKNSGIEAFILCMHCTIDIDLIITGLGLPDIKGQTLAKAIKSFSSTPIIAYTTMTAMEYERTRQKNGIDDYLLKPINLIAAKEIVDNQLLKKTHEQEKYK